MSNMISSYAFHGINKFKSYTIELSFCEQLVRRRQSIIDIYVIVLRHLLNVDILPNTIFTEVANLYETCNSTVTCSDEQAMICKIASGGNHMTCQCKQGYQKNDDDSYDSYCVRCELVLL